MAQAIRAGLNTNQIMIKKPVSRLRIFTCQQPYSLRLKVEIIVQQHADNPHGTNSQKAP